MSHADPWDEVQRLERLLDAELRAELQRSELRAAAESYCVDTCRVDGSCPIERSLPTRTDCPLFKYTQALTAAIVPESLT